jgi:HrpA-like RNA helicase
METFSDMEETQPPEILRMGLAKMVLDSKVWGAQDLSINELFAHAMDAPQPEQIAAAIALLLQLGAMDQNEDLSPLGKILAQLSIGPQLGTCLVMSCFLRCLDPVLSIVVYMDER